MTNNKYFFLSLILLGICATFVLTIAKRGEPEVVKTNLENLPMHIAGYEGEKDRFPQGVYDTLDADLHLYRHYYAGDGTRLSLYLGYYGTAKGGRTSHNPYGCLPGSGWGIIETDSIRIYPSYYPKGVDVNFVLAGKDGVNNVMLHWYHAAGTKVLSSGLQQNIERFMGRVFKNRNDGAYVQVNSLASDEEIPIIKDKARIFVGEIMELLPKYWPEEK